MRRLSERLPLTTIARTPSYSARLCLTDTDTEVKPQRVNAIKRNPKKIIRKTLFNLRRVSLSPREAGLNASLGVFIFNPLIATNTYEQPDYH